MAEIWIGKDLANDPWATTTDDISEYYHVQSTGWGGTDKAKTVPSVNYPVVTPARIFVELPMVIDRSDLTGSRPIKVIDTTIGSTMTRVATAPTGNEYRIPPASSIRRDVIEVSSTKVGNILDFDYYGEGCVFNASEYNTFRQFLARTSIVANLTISDIDYLGFVEVAHTSTTALVTVTLPTVADNTERRILIKNTGNGITKVDGEGAETLSIKGNSVASWFLYMEDDWIECISNGTEWKCKGFCSIKTGEGINTNDETNRQISCSFEYDNKSDSTDWTGQHISVADGGSVQKAIVIEDTGGTGNSGTFHVYAITDNGTSLGYWTNNQVVTAGASGATCDVNEGGGSSKNQEGYFFHNLGVPFDIFTKYAFYFYSSDNINVAWMYNAYFAGSGSAYGNQPHGIDTNSFVIRTGDAGVAYLADTTGNGGLYTNAEIYIYINVEIVF